MIIDLALIGGVLLFKRSNTYARVVQYCSVFKRRDHSKEKQASEPLRPLEILFALIWQIAFMLPIALVCGLFGLFYEFIFVWVSFIAARKIIDFSLYIKDMKACFAFCLVFVYCLCKITLPLNMSFFFPVFVGAGSAVVLAAIAFKQSEYSTIKEKAASQDDLKNERLKKVLELKQRGWRHVDIAVYLDVSEKTVQRDVERIRKQLGIELKSRGSP